MDASPPAIIHAFIQGLSDLLSTLLPGGTRPDQTSLYFWVATSASVTFTADRDYNIESVLPLGGSNSCCLSLNNTTYTAAWQASGSGNRGLIFVGGVASNPQVFTKIPFLKDQKLYLWNNGSTTVGMMVYLSAR